jgi:hypothetical protein
MSGDAPQGDGRTAMWLVGITAFAAWLVMLWLMFGDVL